MVTADEIAGIAVFAALSQGDRERLSRAAADIALVAGEFAAHQGSERALFAVLEGRIEAVQSADGIERVVGERRPGDIFGEVPITLGTVFPVGFRAAESSRVMRVEPHDYHAVAAVAPDSARRSASSRATGSAARPACKASRPTPSPRAIVVGHRWDASCAVLRRFLDRNQVTFTWLQPDAHDAVEQWGGPSGRDDCPVIRVIDGKTVVRPQLRRVAELLDLGTEARTAEYDTVIIGAGPAGLAAAVYGASEGLRTLVIEREAPGGQAGTSSRIENYLGFPAGVSGDELASRALQQARGWAPRSSSPARSPDRRRNARAAPRRRRLLQARTIILACGVCGDICRPRASIDSSARASPTGPPAVRRRTRTASMFTSWAQATQPARPPCSSRPTPEV